jgi:hypothetical protein
MALTINLNKKGTDLLIKLGELPKETVAELAGVQTTLIERPGTAESTLELARTFQTLPAPEAAQYLDFLDHMCANFLSKVKKPGELVEALVQAVKLGNATVTTRTLQSVKSALTLILVQPNLALKSKAYRLMHSHDRVFTSAEIFSDVRPVFSISGTPKIEAAIAFHTISLNFLNNGEAKTMSFALDSKDLDDLKNVIERALKKDRAIRKFISASGTSQMIVNES